MGEIQLHPIAATLAASAERSADQGHLVFPRAATEKARAQLRATRGHEAVHALVALAAKLRRIAGEAAVPAIAAIAVLVIDALGSADEAHDMFARAGLNEDGVALLGIARVIRAPMAAAATPTSTPKLRRGLARAAPVAISALA